MAAAAKDLNNANIVPLHQRRKLAFAYTRNCIVSRDGKSEVSFKKFKNSTAVWSDIVKEMATPYRATTEREAEYSKFNKSRRLLAKATPGAFLTGVCEGGSRAKSAVNKRDVLCIDYDSKDNYHAETAWQTVRDVDQYGDMFGSELADLTYLAHTTRSHVDDSQPRFRILLPLTRTVNPEEYAFLCRFVAQMLDPDMRGFDRTTTEANRVMFFPSVSRDQEFYFFKNEGQWVDVDAILSENAVQFADLSQWPLSVEEVEVIDTFTKKEVQDPLTKEGEVGAFCRTYAIQDVLYYIIPGVYEDGDGDRFTFVGGSSANGAQIFEDKWLYSHHGTDPASGHMNNAFDLVRIHKFGHLDKEDSEAAPNRLPSYKAMVKFCREDRKVLAELFIRDEENVEGLFDALDPVTGDEDDLSDLFGEEEETSEVAPESENSRVANTETAEEPTAVYTSQAEMVRLATEIPADWKEKIASTMEVNDQGRVLRSLHTIQAIMDNSPKYRGMFMLNEFTGQVMVVRNLTDKPGVFRPTPMTDIMEINIATQIFKDYDWTGETITRSAIFDCYSAVATRYRYHPVQDYLRALTWDGVPRAETFFIRYLKSPDNAYIKDATLKWFLAAVTRVFHPGAKFDNAVVLEGPQGVGKSTLFSLLAKKQDWFTDHVDINANPREVAEALVGKWIVEMGELDAVSRATNERAKKFMSTREYTYRAAYARNTAVYKLQCVFGGSTNRSEWLTDETGNRRYWPIPSAMRYGEFIDINSARAEVDQVWAEVMHVFNTGEYTLAMSDAAADIASEYQDSRVLISEDDVVREVIEKYLNDPIDPEGDFQDEDNPGPKYRTRVSINELWTCALGNRASDRIGPSKLSAVGRIAGETPGWRLVKKKTTLVDDGTGVKRRLVFVERTNNPD